MTENIMTTGKFAWKLIIWIGEILETILPQTHIFEAATCFLIRFYPIRRTERHHHKEVGHKGNNGTKDHTIWEGEKLKKRISDNIRNKETSRNQQLELGGIVIVCIISLVCSLFVDIPVGKMLIVEHVCNSMDNEIGCTHIKSYDVNSFLKSSRSCTTITYI